MKKIIITGGLGFIGTNLILNLLKENSLILNLDKDSQVSNAKLKKIKLPNYSFRKIDLSKTSARYILLKIIKNFKPNFIINLASESNVDKAIENPSKIYSLNVNSTLNLLIAIKKSSLKKIRLIHIGTDEVYGDLELASKKKFTELSSFRTNNPYSASKASQIHIVQSFIRTYNLKAIILNPSNNYGFFQYPEKFIPRSVNLIISKGEVQLYGDGRNIRNWIFVEDSVEAIKVLMEKGKLGETYNLSSNYNISNKLLIKLISKILHKISKKKYFIKINYVTDRPGHDRKYVSDNKKIRALGWKPKININNGLVKTIYWYLNKNNLNLFKSINPHIKRYGLRF